MSDLIRNVEVALIKTIRGAPTPKTNKETLFIQTNYDSLLCLCGGELLRESSPLSIPLNTAETCGRAAEQQVFLSQKGGFFCGARLFSKTLGWGSIQSQVNALSNAIRSAVCVWGERILFGNKNFHSFSLFLILARHTCVLEC